MRLRGGVGEGCKEGEEGEGCGESHGDGSWVRESDLLSGSLLLVTSGKGNEGWEMEAEKSGEDSCM